MRLLAKGEGYRCQTANSPQAALELLAQAEFDLALIDLNYARDTTSGKEGLDLLAGIQALDPTLPVVVMLLAGAVFNATFTWLLPNKTVSA